MFLLLCVSIRIIKMAASRRALLSLRQSFFQSRSRRYRNGKWAVAREPISTRYKLILGQHCLPLGQQKNRMKWRKELNEMQGKSVGCALCIFRQCDMRIDLNIAPKSAWTLIPWLLLYKKKAVSYFVYCRICGHCTNKWDLTDTRRQRCSTSDQVCNCIAQSAAV